ncbi:MAG: proprotein convertase P-domain-containing protein [Verrucomicrobiota bacterium]
MKLLFSLCALLPLSASAATLYDQIWTVTTAIPDNDPVGLTNTQNVSATGLTSITGITVDLTFTGGWNGDLYAYLVHGSGFSVLLNRPGRSDAAQDGSGTAGFTITLDDSASPEIHTAIPMSGGNVAGTYRPDGRAVDPSAVLDTHARTATLASFDGLDPNGTWTLFVADQSAGGTATLQSWGLHITAVPEPSSLVLTLLASGALLLRRKRG